MYACIGVISGIAVNQEQLLELAYGRKANEEEVSSDYLEGVRSEDAILVRSYISKYVEEGDIYSNVAPSVKWFLQSSTLHLIVSKVDHPVFALMSAYIIARYIVKMWKV
jgi:hypothetical protein